MTVLNGDFYRQRDVVSVSRQLIGKFLVTEFGGRTAGMIIETEAYKGPEDKASHAYGGRRTKRTEAMYLDGGAAYVYLCYGIHSLFNVVTNTAGIPHAILVRAILPAEGMDLMAKRRGKKRTDPLLADGPGTLTQALGIGTVHNARPLTEPPLWIEDRRVVITDDMIAAGPRIGVGYAEEDAHLPWRFRLKKEALNEIVNSPLYQDKI